MLHEIGSKSTCKRLIIKLSYPKKHGDVAYGSPSQDKKRRKIQHSEKSVVILVIG
jgi:hypothetical protein